jgi:His-Xaa-Ser system protein HxsD
MADLDGRQDLDRNDRHEDTVDHAGPIVRTEAGVVAVSVSRALYSKRVALSAAYKLSDRWAVLVDEDGPERWALYLLGLSPEGAEAGLTTLVHELTDQAVRERLDQETRDLRTLIVAQAFSEGNLLDPTRESDAPPFDTREPGADRPR